MVRQLATRYKYSEKCFVLHLGFTNSQIQYTLDGCLINDAQNVTDLRVDIDGVTLCHIYSSSNMTLVINLNISVWERRTSECCTIYNLFTQSNKYMYIYKVRILNQF